MMLLTGINLAYYQTLMAGLRSAISEQRLNDFIAETKAGWERGDLPPYTRPNTSLGQNS